MLKYCYFFSVLLMLQCHQKVTRTSGFLAELLLRIRNRERGVVPGEYYKPINLNDTMKYAKVFLTVNFYHKQENVFTSSYKHQCWCCVERSRSSSKVNLVCFFLILEDTEDGIRGGHRWASICSEPAYHANTLVSDFVRNTRSEERCSSSIRKVLCKHFLLNRGR